MNEQLKLVLALLLDSREESSKFHGNDTIIKTALNNSVIKKITERIIFDTHIKPDKNYKDRLLEVYSDEIDFIFNSLNKHSGK